jgi:CRISPR-associated protein Cas5t
MRALRIVLTQNKAHYRKEESLQNKMTYPLPPFSTVIGALHRACRFRTYQPMDLSIQGSYQSLSRQPYSDHSFLDSVMDDRGILVKMKSATLLSSSFDKVATALKSQGNSFKKNVTINIHNQELMQEYWQLRKLNDELTEYKNTRLKRLNDLFKKRKKTLVQKKKNVEKKSDAFMKLTEREKEIKAKEKKINNQFKAFEDKHYKQPISLYQSLTTSLKYYEILHEVKLIIHVKADEETLACINENIYCLKSLGRSEDFVDVLECEFVELVTEVEDEVVSPYSAYLNADVVKCKEIRLTKRDDIPASGTKYWINKNYTCENGYREFEKVKVVYASNYFVEEESGRIWIDVEKDLIVNFN